MPQGLVCDVSARLLPVSLFILCPIYGLDFSVGAPYSRMMGFVADKLFLLISALSAFHARNDKQGL